METVLTEDTFQIFNIANNKLMTRCSGIVQLVEWSLPTPEIRDSNLIIGKFIYNHLCLKHSGNKEKRGLEWPFLLKLVKKLENIRVIDNATDQHKVPVTICVKPFQNSAINPLQPSFDPL